MSIIKGLFLGLKNQKVIPFNQMTPELHNQISSGLAKIMMAAKMTKAKLTKSQQNYIMNQAKQVQEFEDRYITGIKDKAGNIISKGKEKVADLFDLKGRKMDPGKSIIGGEQAGIMGIEKTSPKFIEYAIRNIKEMKSPQSVKDEINFIIKREGMYKNLTSDDAKQILDAIEPIVKKADGGRIGYKDGMLKRGLKAITGTDTYKTLEDRGFNAAVLMSEGFDQIYNLLSGVPGLAEGGRIGYKDGPDKPGRRKFMKMAAGIASLLPFGIGKVSKVAAPVVTKAAEITGPALAKIVETVMSAGKFISITGTRVKNMVTKKKLGKVEVEEDIQDGSYIIKKDGKEIYYKPGRMDETGGFEDDIIEVIEKRVKKADGGIGYMLGE